MTEHEAHPIAPGSSASQKPEEEAAQPDEAASTIQIPLPAEPEATLAEETETSTPVASHPPAMTPVPATPALPAVSVEDLLELQIAADPQLAPAGTLIAFCLQRCDRATNSTHSAIWLVPSTRGAGEARPLTGGETQDFAPRWSPDGETLAFLSTRDGGIPQIFLLPMRGGEARQLTHLPQGVSEYSWRPDGLALLAHSLWKPADDSTQPTLDEERQLYTRLDEQWDGAGHLQGRHLQLWLISLDGTALRLTAEPVHLVQSCWSPDGRAIAFCANRRQQPDLSSSMALWVLTLASGEMRRLTPEEGLAQLPSWSPDGRYLAYYYAPDQTETANVTPWLVAAHGEEAPRPLFSQESDRSCQAAIVDELRSSEEWLTRPQWYPDSRHLLITVHERGQAHLYRLDSASGELQQLTSGNGRYLTPHLSSNGQMIALVRADWFTPGDIWGCASDGSQLRRLTGINERFLRSHRLTRPRRISWQSKDHLTIEGWLYLPSLAPGTRTPLVLAVHGGPACAWGDAYIHEFQVLAGRGIAVLAANPRGSDGYGEAFRRAILNDWGGDDLGDLLAGIDHVIANEPIDSERLGISGLSYGGYMTTWAISQTTRFKAAVSRNGVTWLPLMGLLSDQGIWFDSSMGGAGEALLYERSPLSHAARISTPLLLLHAAEDLRCPFSESLQLFTALRKRRQIVELVRYPHTSHLMDRPGIGTPIQRLDRLQRTVAWFEHFLCG